MIPLGNRVLLKKLQPEDVGNVSIPPGTSIVNEPCIGEVLAVPAHRKDLKVGDKVIFAPAQSLQVYIDEELLYIASYDVIFLKL